MEAEKKKKRRNIVFFIAALLVIAMLIMIPFLLDAQQKNEADKASILSTRAVTGNIQKTLSGTGTLTEQEADEITVPQGVKVTQYLVQNGQFVKKGDPVAVVDKVSVMETVSTVHEAMAEVETELETLRNGSNYTYLAAPASGRVKAVYAAKGDLVQDVILQHGALAVLSLDGLMSVSFPANGRAVIGQAVTVLLSDGTEVSGRVETVVDGEVTITISDQYGSIGETVEVRSGEGSLLGSGPLSVHSPWNAMATGGTVSDVYVEEGRTISVYGTLLVLSGTAGGGNYEELAALHRDYEDTMAELFQMYQNGTLTASCDGCVSGVDEDILKTLAAGSGEKAVLKLLANAPGNNPDAQFTNVIGIVTDAKGSAVLQTWPTEIEDYTDTAFIVTATESFTKKYKFPPAPAYQWVTEETEQDVYKEFKGDSFDPKTTYYLYVETASGEFKYVEKDDAETVPQEEITYYTKTTELVQSGTWMKVDIAVGGIYVFAFDKGDNLVWLVYLGSSDTLPETEGDKPEQQQKPQSGEGMTMPSGGGMGAVGGSGMGAVGGGGMGAVGGGGSSAAAEEDSVYSTVGTTILSITPQETVSVSITVDELDILSVHVGQEVQVTLDALPGQAFTGTITGVNTTASNEGGNSKYSAVVTLNRTGMMLGGMNASANITVEERNDVLLLPAETLFEQDRQTMVYTAYDSRTETLSEPVAVKTGLSNGLQVQILSGLEEGDTVWYSYYDTLEIQGLSNDFPRL